MKTSKELGEQAPVYLVTGAGSGIGRSIALTLSAEGAKVGVFDRDGAGADSVVAEIFAAQGSEAAISLGGDITSSDDIESGIDELVARFGPLSGAVANAGIWTPGTVLDLSDAEWDRAISVNLTGMFTTARAVMRHLVASGRGSFVAISSDAGLQGAQNCAAYVACKHAVVGLVRSMALDFGPRGVRSNAVCPGFVDTPLAESVFRNASAELVDARHAEIPLGRFAEPGEVAELVAFLLGDKSSFINGAAIACDGGATSGYFNPESIGQTR